MRNVFFSILPASLLWLAASCGATDTGQCAANPEPVGMLTDRDDAVVIALRMQAGIALDARLVAQLEHVLQLARTAVPAEVASIHALAVRSSTGPSTLNTLLMEATGAVADTFDRGACRTGILELDQVLTQYQFAEAHSLLSTSPPRTYALVFHVPLQTRRLADLIKSLRIDDVIWVSPNGVVGDGDDIFAERTGNAWMITFRHGDGDCPAGCTVDVRTRVRVGDDNTVQVLSAEGHGPT